LVLSRTRRRAEVSLSQNRRQFAAAVFSSLTGVAMAQEAKRTPVLVELFTSEGCSSCPPADLLLEKLDRLQPVAGAAIIVLSEHVDYWNSAAWKDPYSSPVFSRRQQTYANRSNLESVYTPQMIVDGAAEFVGNDGRRAQSAIAEASKQEKIGVRIATAAAGVRIEVDALPKSAGRRDADVYFVQADESGTNDIAGGENKGRRLHHIAIARRIEKLGTVSARSGFSKDAPAAASPAAMRWIAFAQESTTGLIWGAAMSAIAGSR
jgi:hypothetical protein